MRKCTHGKCKDPHHSRGFCRLHYSKLTTVGFLNNCYNNMKKRVSGRGTKSPKYFIGKEIMSKEQFYEWAMNDSRFLVLFKSWISNECDIRLTPSPNRLNSSKGYKVSNLEWITLAQNSQMAVVARLKNNEQKKQIYNILGVKK